MVDEWQLSLQPIGRVSAGRPVEDRGCYRWEEAVATIDICDEWAGALDGIEGFSHVWVIWAPHRFSEPPESPYVHPEGRLELPLVGLFATRSPRRPNPLAITAVRLMGREGSVLAVQGLDAEVGTPVLDIKPYLRRGDLIPEATMPDWLERLWRMHDAEREA